MANTNQNQILTLTPNTDQNKLIGEESSLNRLQHNNNPARKSRDLYVTHKFDADLGFSSMEDMIELSMDSGLVEEDIPRHLVIKDKGDKCFSKHPRRMIILALKKFLEIEREEDLPSVGIWNGEKSVEVNVEVNNDNDARKLLSTTEIFGVGVEVVPHHFRNYSTARVWDNEGLFEKFSDEQLAEILKNKGIVKVKREEYTDRKTKEKKKGRRYRLIFNKRVPPKELKFPAIGIKMETELYIPPPMQCFHCQRLGHGESSCRNKAQGKKKICFHCGHGHDGDLGSKCVVKEAKCVNCKCNHSSLYRGCPAYQQELNIKKIATEKRVSPREVMLKMKSLGEYIDYANERTAAKKVTAVQDEISHRLGPVESSVQELKNMMIHFLEGRKTLNKVSEDAMEIASDFDDTEDSMRSLVEENQELKNQLRQQESVCSEVELLKEELKKLTEEGKRNLLEKENEHLRIVEQENKYLKASLEELREEMGRLRREESNDEITYMREEIKRLKQDCEALKSLKESKEKENDTVVNLKKDLKDIKKQNAELSKMLAGKDESMRKMMSVHNIDETNKLKSEIETYKKKLNEKDRELKSMKSKVEINRKSDRSRSEVGRDPK